MHITTGSLRIRAQVPKMADSIMSKAATMEIPINSNGDAGTLPEDDSLEQAAQVQWRLDEKDCHSVLAQVLLAWSCPPHPPLTSFLDNIYPSIY
ncbi:arfaptin-2-like [Arapaima gigas]